uniref:Olfactomedin-like domain-containing protein n=1 Tax=Leptobrachium leishanense TaxID=445787 RepID=A0A8C5QKV1_9ANUR
MRSPSWGDSPWYTSTFSGSLDNNGICQCAVRLPDSTFPANHLEALQEANHNLSVSFQEQLSKVRGEWASGLEQLDNLTRRVRVIEMGGLSLMELNFEPMKVEIKEMESIVQELKTSFRGSSAVVETLFEEVQNISTMANQLESYDKNNVLVVRRDMASLRRRLEDCQQVEKSFSPPPRIDFGSCQHGGIENISKPFVVQLNWRGFNFKAGGWGRDSFYGSTEQKYWVSILEQGSSYFTSVRLYPSYDDLVLYRNPVDKTPAGSSNRGYGSGMIVFNDILYYNCQASQYLCKFNLSSNAIERQLLPNAAYNNRFSYASSLYQDIDLAADEYGFWAIYSTEKDEGKIVLSKLNATSLAVEKTWLTSQYKLGVTNAFMVCGVLYATRTLNTRAEEIFYMFDTATGNEGHMKVPLDKMMENVQSLSYNPNDHKLYMYNDGYMVNYDLFFKQPK